MPDNELHANDSVVHQGDNNQYYHYPTKDDKNDFKRGEILLDPEFRDRLERIRDTKRSVDGTCRWILDCENFIRWNKHEESQLLAITGDAGIGKTVMSLFLLREFSRDSGTHDWPITQAPIHYFCDSQDHETTSDIAILRALIWQLCIENGPWQMFKKDVCEQTEPLEDLLANINFLTASLRDLLVRFKKGRVIIIIDGLDECDASPRKEFLHRLRSLLQTPNLVLKAIVSCRNVEVIQEFLNPVPDIDEAFQPQPPSHDQCVKMDSDSIKEDLYLYVSTRVTSLAKKKRYGNTWKEEAERTLHKLSGGTFLWTHFAIRQLENYEGIPPVEEVLRQLPQNLFDLYDSILDKIPQKEVEDTRFILQLLSAARRLMNIKEVFLCYSLKSENLEEPVSTLDQFQQLEYVIHRRSDLVHRDENRNLHFIHHTVQEYLSESPYLLPNRIQRTPASLRIDPVSSNYLLFRICFKVLGSKHFESMESDKASMSQEDIDIARYSVENMQAHTVKAIELVANGLRSSTKALKKLAYLRDLLLEIISGIVHPRSEELVQLLLDCGAEVDHLSTTEQRPLTIAASFDNVPVVKVLLKNKADVQKVGRKKRTPLNWSFHDQRWRVAAFLLQQMSVVDVESPDGHEPLLLALSPYEIIRTRSKHEASRNAFQVNGGTLPLQPTWDENVKPIFIRSQHTCASARGKALSFNGELFMLPTPIEDHIGMAWPTVALLISRTEREKINSQDCYKRTALSYAAESGLADMVNLLLKCGADPNAKDEKGVTPLMWAVRCCTRGITEFEKMSVYDDARMILGNILQVENPSDALEHLRKLHDQKMKVINYLLKNDCDIDAKDDSDHTALDYAMEGRVKDIVDVLIKSKAGSQIARPSAQQPNSNSTLEQSQSFPQPRIPLSLAGTPGLEGLWVTSDHENSSDACKTADITYPVKGCVPPDLLPLWELLLYMPKLSFKNVSLHGNSRALCGNIIVVKIPGPTQQHSSFAIRSCAIGQHNYQDDSCIRSDDTSTIDFPVFYAGEVPDVVESCLQRWNRITAGVRNGL